MYQVAALYHFTRFEQPERLRDTLFDVCVNAGIRGTLLLAREGLNGTIAGSTDAIGRVLVSLRHLPGCDGLDCKLSHARNMPFARLKVRVKAEIVTMGQDGVDPTAAVGRYVTPAQWNALADDPDVVLIDTRNHYETAIGTFDNAILPNTRSFRDFPEWWQQNASRFDGKKVAMFCTGGIRCEKATSYLLGAGVGDVFHLRGGILSYLEQIPEADSRWHGECFVFDQRVALGHGLQPGEHVLCYGCRRPLNRADRARPEYEPGVSCHHCLDRTTPEQRRGFRERHRQMEQQK